jgi:hypothetical protein
MIQADMNTYCDEEDEPFVLIDELMYLQQSFAIKIAVIERFISEADKTIKATDFKGTHKEWAMAKRHTDVAENFIKQLNETFEELLKFSNEHNYYFHFCSPIVYEFYFESFKQNYLDSIPNSTLSEFYEHEINSLLQDQKPDESFYKKSEIEDLFLIIDYYQYLSEKNKTIINLNNKRKGEYVLTCIVNDNCKVSKISDKKVRVYQSVAVLVPKSISEVETPDANTEFFKKHIDIFKDNESAELFIYLEENHIDNYPKAKYIDIFRYLHGDLGLIYCTQNTYIDFIKKSKDIGISKITPETHKYKEKTLSKFKNMHALFLENRLNSRQ